MGTALHRARPLDLSVLARLFVTTAACLVTSMPSALQAQDGGVEETPIEMEPSAPAAPSGAPDADVGAEEPSDGGAPDAGTSDAGEPSAEPTPADPVVAPEPTPAPAPTAPGPTTRDAPRTPVSEAASTIEGRIVDAETGEPLIEATVFAEQGDQRIRTYTDMDGNFQIEVPPGLWVVHAFADFYREARHRPVRVRTGQRVSVTIRLREGSDEHLVFETVERADRRTDAVLMRDRINSTVSADTIGAQQMANTGLSNAARAASRVVGATVDNSGLLIVRGLSDRYVNVLMNGVQLPGMDPDRNGVQIDVIPAAVISNISIVKTFQPNLPANWAGGLAIIESPSMPDRFVVRFSAQVGYNSTATFRYVPDNAGTRGDPFGFGLRGRQLHALNTSYGINNGGMRPDGTTITPDDLAAIARSPARRWNIFDSREAPNSTFQFSIGNQHELRHGRRFGYLGGINYQRQAQLRVGPANNVSNIDDEGRPTYAGGQYQSRTTYEDVLLTAFATASLRYSNNGDLKFLTLYTRNGNDETRHQIGYEPESGQNIDRWLIRYTQRSVAFHQIVGEQRAIPWFTDAGARLRYSAYLATSRRDEPDTRLIRYAQTPSDDPTVQSPYALNDASRGSNIFVLGLKQRDAGGYAHFDFPLWRGNESEGSAEIGVDTRFSSRTSTFRDFHYRMRGSPTTPDDYDQLSPNDLFSPTYLTGTRPIQLQELTDPINNYAASSRWFGMYLTTDMKFTSWFRFAGGLRLETMDRELRLLLDAISGLTPPAEGMYPENIQHRSIDPLPAGTLIFTPRESMNVRISYGLTVLYPQFREFSPSNYYDFARQRSISGNPDLQRTHVHNADVRWEWLRGTTGLFAVSGFYKYFLHPIERINTSAGGSRDLSYSNAKSGYLVGTELEARFNFGQFDDTSNWLDFFQINGNLALVYSQVQLSAKNAEAQPSLHRAMFYQSPYVANLSLGFDHPDSGVSVNVAYNVVGPRIVEVGTVATGAVLPNVVEQSFQQLDLIGGYQINDHLRLSLTCRNLIRGQRRTLMQGPAVVERYDPGMDVLVGLTLQN